MSAELVHSAIASVPCGAWAVAVSGGADSVALLSLLRSRVELRLHVAHLDHETRDGQSAEDARFVELLCRQWSVPLTLARRSDIEPMLAHLPGNLPSRFRRLRIELFRRVVETNHLDGVILAHHADDQAETALHRLLRGSAPNGLTGMSPRARIGGVVILRPMLSVRRETLRSALRQAGQPWREDSSNSSSKYLRNRLRALLEKNPPLTDALMELSTTCRALRNWSRGAAPSLASNFPAIALARLPQILAREAARHWLSDRGVPAGAIDRATIQRLIEMACDAASPSRQQFPGNVLVRRRGGLISSAATDHDSRAKYSSSS